MTVRLWLGCAMVVSAACTSSRATAEKSVGQSTREVRSRLAAYADAAKAVDANRSASFFSKSGTLFEPGIPPIVGDSAIRAFIASFPGVKVDSAMMRADTVEVHEGTAYVWGTYFERLDFPGQPRSSQHGRFVMQWLRGADSTWRIERYYRVPLPAGWQDR